jgi:hypothetical protein
MTDPIEQAREDAMAEEAYEMMAARKTYDRVVIVNAYEDERPIGEEDAAFATLEQAILRYHPDVVRLVEAARGIQNVRLIRGASGPKRSFTMTFEDTGELEALEAALVPFKEVQE